VLYTVPAGVSTIVKNVILCNDTAAAATVSLTIAGVPVMATTIGDNSTVTLDISAVMLAGNTITASGGTADAISVYISGVEIT
jgi:hypothetical protein